MLCILGHWRVQLILAYSWARPTILIAGKGRGEWFYFFCFFTFIPVSLSSLSLSFISTSISSISFLPSSGRWHKVTHKGWRVIKPQHNQSVNQYPQHMLFSVKNMLWVLIRSTSLRRFWWVPTTCFLEYSLEVPHQGASNEYPQHMFLRRNKKNYPRIITKYSSLTSPLIIIYHICPKHGNIT